MEQIQNREHLFISYASEDYELAEWLTLKLTNEGYKVWCDRFQLLGGESYPRDIDDAIKNKTFRMIALLSHNSINKTNPIKERTLALNIGRERGIDFLIPLNVDGLSSTELDWMTNDIVYIPFNESWAEGLRRLLKKLNSIDAPRNLKNGKKIVADIFTNSRFIDNAEEIILTNFFPIEKIPEKIKLFSFKTRTTQSVIKELSYKWDCYMRDTKTVFSFHEPPEDIKNDYLIEKVNEITWANKSDIDGISVENIVKNLLLKSVYMICSSKGLLRNNSNFYFPDGLLEKNKIFFIGYKQNKTRVTVTSIRKKSGGSDFAYYLSPVFNVRKDDFGRFVLYINVFLHITDRNGEYLSKRTANSCRKLVRKNWWNDDLINRVLAITSFLSDGEEKVVIGNSEDEQIILPSRPNELKSPISINEEILNKESYKKEDIVEFEDEDNIEEFEEVPL
jgi:hypothetical protein